MIGALARVPIARITRSRIALLSLFGWTALAVAVAIIDRGHTSGHGASGVLLHAFGSVALPLLAFGIATAVANGNTLSHSGRALVALGAPPARVATASVLTAIVASALMGVVLGAVVLVVAGTDRPLGDDLLTTAWVAALGGAAYGALFSLGSTFRWGRGALLIADAFMGSFGSLGSVILPRAHLRSLLGGMPANDLAQQWSVLALAAITVLCAALAIRRGR
ncbi:MAG: hypothetical protein JWM74_4384 [Myxococcaceae bacterium]|nr:hypothetical protein [Myxococcaceae bacterium]